MEMEIWERNRILRSLEPGSEIWISIGQFPAIKIIDVIEVEQTKMEVQIKRIIDQSYFYTHPDFIEIRHNIFLIPYKYISCVGIETLNRLHV